MDMLMTTQEGSDSAATASPPAILSQVSGGQVSTCFLRTSSAASTRLETAIMHSSHACPVSVSMCPGVY